MCVKVSSSFIEVKCLNNHKLSAKKGVLIPGEQITLPCISEKDKFDLQFALKNRVDFVAGSFVRKPSHVLDIRAHLGVEGENIKVIAKIEN